MPKTIDKKYIKCPVCKKMITEARATSHFLQVHDPNRKKKQVRWHKLDSGGDCGRCGKTFDSLWQYAEDKSNSVCESCMKKIKVKQRTNQGKKKKSLILYTPFESNTSRH
jgi:DNA-directed RNA polymerase subunit RPC12/RpoP